ncbi:MAG: serine hydrolase [Vicinamibacterales bacterium]
MSGAQGSGPRAQALALAALLVCAVPLVAQQGPVQADLRAQLVKQLDGITANLKGVIGYRIVDLTSGEQVAARLEKEPFPTASTIKLSILYEMLKQAEAGTLALDTPAPLNRAQVVGGTGVLQFLTAPVLTLRDQAALMIIVSDNTATNVVIDAVGMDQVNARMTALGLGDIKLRRKMMDSAAVKRGDENIASPAALSRIAELLWKGEGLKPESRDAARKFLHQVPGQIRNAVPDAVLVASKTGELDGVRAEAAVVELAGRPFALAVMTTYLVNDADGLKAIHDVAASAYSYFDRVATGGAYGRRQP